MRSKQTGALSNESSKGMYFIHIQTSLFFSRLNDEARKLIAELGSSSITNLGFRDNWVFCGGKGIKTKSPFEQVMS